MDDKVVELIRFTQLSEAEMLANVLKSEGVACHVRDRYMNQIYKGVDLGGVSIELLEKDIERAREIMKAYGYLPSDDKPVIQNIDDESETLSEEAITETKQSTDKQARTMMLFCFLLIILLGILVLLHNYFS